MSSNTNTNTNTNTNASSSSTTSTSNSGARHFRHSQSSYSEASFVLNGDGTWSSQETRGSQVGEKKDHFSRVQEGTYKKNEESKSYDFTVTKDEHKSSNPDDRIEDHTGKVISRPIGDIEHFGGFRSLMYDFPMLSLPHSLLSSASSSGSAAAAIEQKKQ